MNETINLSDIIKIYIKIREKNLKKVAKELNIPYKTLTSQLNRNNINAYLLFQLKNILDIDLNWLANMLDKKRKVSILDPIIIPRMQNDFRKHFKPIVEESFKNALKENPSSIACVRNKLISDFNLYLLLDVLLSEDYQIMMINNGRIPRYFCIPISYPQKQTKSIRNIPLMISEREMLDNIIVERKEYNENYFL